LNHLNNVDQQQQREEAAVVVPKVERADSPPPLPRATRVKRKQPSTSHKLIETRLLESNVAKRVLWLKYEHMTDVRFLAVYSADFR
jgi:hypothetical protein